MVRNKRGQLTIFIILALIIVAAIIVFFLYNNNVIRPKTPDTRLQVEKCIDKKIKENIIPLALSAGQIEQQFKTMYQSENISILCYSGEYYEPCVVQDPFPKQTFEKSLSILARDDIESCYRNGIDELEKKGYDVILGKINYELSINPGEIDIIISPSGSISSEDSSSRINSLKIKIQSNIYEVLMIATSILQFEVAYGDSDTTTFMTFYPNLKVEKIRAEDGMKIYIISSNEEIKYRFASRSRAWPPGFG